MKYQIAVNRFSSHVTLLCLFFSMFTISLRAQSSTNYTMKRHAFGQGGGKGQSTQFSLQSHAGSAYSGTPTSSTNYSLTGGFFGGHVQMTPVETDMPDLPQEFCLLQNHPNPFNMQTSIPFLLPSSEEVTIVIYNIQGQQVRFLEKNQRPAGEHLVRWDGRDDRRRIVNDGIYLCRFSAGTYRHVIRMVLIK